MLDLVPLWDYSQVHEDHRAFNPQVVLRKYLIRRLPRAFNCLAPFYIESGLASPAALKADLRNASILRDGRVVFNIAGNKYRLVVWINYPYRVVYIRFIGTHGQYDAIDPQTI